jgi:chromosome segregation ATPase
MPHLSLRVPVISNIFSSNTSPFTFQEPNVSIDHSHKLLPTNSLSKQHTPFALLMLFLLAALITCTTFIVKRYSNKSRYAMLSTNAKEDNLEHSNDMTMPTQRNKLKRRDSHHELTCSPAEFTMATDDGQVGELQSRVRALEDELRLERIHTHGAHAEITVQRLARAGLEEDIRQLQLECERKTSQHESTLRILSDKFCDIQDRHNVLKEKHAITVHESAIHLDNLKSVEQVSQVKDDELELANDQIDHLHDKLATFKDEFEEARTLATTQYRRLSADAQESRSNAAARIAELDLMVAVAIEEAAKWKKLFDNLTRIASDQRLEDKRLVKEAVEKIDDLKADAMALRILNHQTIIELHNSRNEVKILHERVEEISETLHQRIQVGLKIQAAQLEAEERSEELERLNEKVTKQSATELLITTNNFTKATNEIAALKQVVADQKKAIRDLENSRKIQLQSINSMDGAKHRVQREHKAMVEEEVSKRVVAEKELKDVQAQLKVQDETASAGRMQERIITTLVQEKAKLVTDHKARLSETLAERVELDKQIKILQSQLNQEQDKVLGIRQAFEQTQKRMAILEGQKQFAEEQISATEKEKNAAEKSLRDVQEELGSTQHQLQIVQEARHHTEQEQTEVHAQLQLMKMQYTGTIDSLQEKLNESSNTNNDLQQVLRFTKTELERFVSERNGLVNSLLQSEEDLRHARSARDDNKTARGIAESALEQAKLKLEEVGKIDPSHVAKCENQILDYEAELYHYQQVNAKVSFLPCLSAFARTRPLRHHTATVFI